MCIRPIGQIFSKQVISISLHLQSRRPQGLLNSVKEKPLGSHNPPWVPGVAEKTATASRFLPFCTKEKRMALGQAGSLACATVSFGVLAFLLGIIAENKKPAAGSAILEGDVTVCIYPSHDPYVSLGAFSAIFLAVASVLGLISIFFPYNKKAVPLVALTRSRLLVVFVILSCLIVLVAEALLIWTTIVENFHRINAVHTTPHCPTAKTGLMGGAAFLALDATLFWLVCQMLTINAREDYFGEPEDDGKGDYDEVLNTIDTAHPAAKS